MKLLWFLVLLFFSSVIVWVLLFSPAAPTEEAEAYHLFANREFQKAEAYLNEHRDAFTPAQSLLYKGYIQRGLGNMDASEHNFEQAAREADREREKELVYEAYLNQAYNGYLRQDPDAMARAISEAEKSGYRNQDWTKFFTVLEERLRNKQPRSLKAWQKEEKRLPLSNWMQKGLGENFNDFWFFIEDARNDIYIGNVTQARQKLREKASHTVEEQMNEIILLEGLTYFNEALEKPFAAATPYFKLAFSYFARVPILQPRYNVYREQILSSLNKQAEELLSAHTYQDMPFYAAIMEKWSSPAQLAKFNTELLSAINANIDEKNETDIRSLLAALNLSLTDKLEREKLAEKFHDRMLNALRAGDTGHVLGDWEAVALFSTTPADEQSQLSNMLATMALELIPTDNAELSSMEPYIEIWYALVRNPGERYAMALEMLQLAEDPFLLEAHPRKSLALMQIAARITPVDKRAEFQKSLNAAVAKINGNTADRLKDVITAYEAGEMAKAWERVQPLLDIDPNNPEVLRYAGLIAYRRDEFRKSLQFLAASGAVDAESQLALAVSEIIAGDAQKGKEWLSRHSEKEDIRSLYIKLGLGSIAEGRIPQGIAWLTAIPDPGQEARAALAYAYEQQGQWKESLKAYESLDPALKGIAGMYAVYVSDLIGIGDLDKAEQALLERNQFPGKLPELSQSFERFNLKTLNSLSLEYLAAAFYKDQRNDLAKALEFADKMKRPGPRELVLKGEILYRLKKYDDAQKTLLAAISEDNTDEKNFQEKAYPLLAKIALDQDNPAEAYLYLQAYRVIRPDSDEYRKETARAALDIRRYDLALEQLDKLQGSEKRSFEEELMRFKALVHLNRFKEAQESGRKLSEHEDLTMPQKLDLAELLHSVRDTAYARTLLKSAATMPQLTPAEKAGVLRLYLAIADYPRAVAFIKENQEALNSSAEGLYAQALVSEGLNKDQQALLYAQKAHKLSPHNHLITSYLENKNPDAAALAKQIGSLTKGIAEENLPIAERLDYIRMLIEFSVQSHKLDPAKPLTDFNELHQAQDMVWKLARSYPFLPQAFYLKGKANFLLNNQQEAFEAFKEALRLDPSYVDAYRYLAILYTKQKNSTEAIQQLVTALLYAPSDPELWQELAALYQQSDNIVAAEASWEAALRYRPNDLQSILALAKLKLELRNPEGALKLLGTALKVSPEDPEALRLQLVALYNPLLKATTMKASELAQKQESAYQAYHKVAPKEAEALRNNKME